MPDKSMNSFVGLSKETVYRDSKTWYAQSGRDEKSVSGALMDFCRKYAGRKILDFGCATGNYIIELKKSGYECAGVDSNQRYVELARKRGVEAYVIDGRLPFEDKTFDTVIIFEVLEHAGNPSEILKEAKRVARKNILISVPNCAHFESLKGHRLTYEHFLELDHVNFFTPHSLSDLLSGYFNSFEIIESGQIYPWLFDTRNFPQSIVSILLRKVVSFMVRMRLLIPKYTACLFAVVKLD